MNGHTVFSQPSEDDVPDALRPLFEKIRALAGFVPNAFLGYVRRPDRFSAWLAHYQLVVTPTGELDTADREMIAVVVSGLNRCTYCAVSHGYALRAQVGAVTADRIAINWRHAGLDARRAAICAYVEKLTLHPGEVTPADAYPLVDAGLSGDAIADVVELTAMYAFTNRMSLASGFVPNPEYHSGNRDVAPVPAGPGRPA